MDIDIKCCDENLDKFNNKEKYIINKANSIAYLKEKYEIKEDKLVLRLLVIKGVIRQAINKDIDYDTLISFLDSEIDDAENINLINKLNSFLCTKTNEDILEIYKQKTIGTR